MEKAKVKERRLASASVPADTGSAMDNRCTPPPPVLLSCTGQSMTFTPAPYTLEEKVFTMISPDSITTTDRCCDNILLCFLLIYFRLPWIYMYCCFSAVASDSLRLKKMFWLYFAFMQVCWYRIYGRKVDGLNLKVRIGDNHLPGTGETVGLSLYTLFSWILFFQVFSNILEHKCLDIWFKK